MKIKIERPNADAARSIFANYLTDEIPIADGHDVPAMIDATVEEMYRDDEANRFLEVTYQNGDKEVMYFKDFSSGAMIETSCAERNSPSSGRSQAAPRASTDDLLSSIRQEFKEHEDLPNTTNPDDWAKISGKKGERIVYVRTLIHTDTDGEGGKAIDSVTTGQYL